NFEGEKIDSKFTYEIDHQKSTLLFTKFKPLDVVAYHILYRYLGDVDDGFNTEVVKYDPEGKQIMRVENVFDTAGLRTHKRVFDEQNALMYFFEYSYDSSTGKFATILKKTPEGEVISLTRYTYNTDGLTQREETLDTNGKTSSLLTYEYQKY
ncbi:MAG: hypothetical protein H3C41_10095, partial [Bacteroidales bacterium]|nr:hypothetical protein [Bacteroidales bacterium]